MDPKKYTQIKNQTLLFFVEKLLEKPRTLHDLSCQFGSKGFTKEMRQIAGGSQSGLKRFLSTYPFLFKIETDIVEYADCDACAENKNNPRDYEKEAVEYFKAKLIQYGLGCRVPIRSLLGHRSQACSEIRHVSGQHMSEFRDFLSRHSATFAIENNEFVHLCGFANEPISYYSDEKSDSHSLDVDKLTVYKNVKFIYDCINLKGPLLVDQLFNLIIQHKLEENEDQEESISDNGQVIQTTLFKSTSDLATFIRFHPQCFQIYSNIVTFSESHDVGLEYIKRQVIEIGQNQNQRKEDGIESEKNNCNSFNNNNDNNILKAEKSDSNEKSSSKPKTQCQLQNSQLKLINSAIATNIKEEEKEVVSKRSVNVNVNVNESVLPSPSASSSEKEKTKNISKLMDIDFTEVPSLESSKIKRKISKEDEIIKLQNVPLPNKRFDDAKNGQATTTTTTAAESETNQIQNQESSQQNGASNIPSSPAVNNKSSLKSRVNKLLLSAIGENNPHNDNIITILNKGKKIVSNLKKTKGNIISMDCEGVNLGPEGNLTLVQIGSPDNQVFLFDILVCPDLINLLKPILESEDTIKVMHDCRNDSVNLYRQFGIRLNNVFDTQVGQFLIDNKNYNYNKLSEKYGLSSNINKEKIKSIYKTDQRIWQRRPLNATMISYAINDVINLIKIYEKMKDLIEDKEYFEELCTDYVLSHIEPETIRGKKRLKKNENDLNDLKSKLSSKNLENIVLSNRELRLLRHLNNEEYKAILDKLRTCNNLKVSRKIDKLGRRGNSPGEVANNDNYYFNFNNSTSTNTSSTTSSTTNNNNTNINHNNLFEGGGLNEFNSDFSDWYNRNYLTNNTSDSSLEFSSLNNNNNNQDFLNNQNQSFNNNYNLNVNVTKNEASKITEKETQTVSTGDIVILHIFNPDK